MTDENISAESAAGESTPQTEVGEQTDLGGLSDSDLENLITTGTDEDEETSEDEDTSTEEEPTPETSTTQKDGAPESQKEAQDEAQSQNQSKQAIANMSPEELQKAYEKQQQVLQQTNEFVQRRNTELGELRKRLRQAQEQLQEGLDEKFQESPQEALKDYQVLQQIDENLKGIDKEEHNINSVYDRQKVVAKHIKPGDVDVEDMLQSLRDDGIQETYVEQFRQNPWQMAQAETIIQLGKRAKAERAIRSLIPVMQKLLEENKQLKQKPQKAINNLVNAIQSESPSISSKHDSDSQRDLSNVDVSEWTEAELNSFLGR